MWKLHKGIRQPRRSGAKTLRDLRSKLWRFSPLEPPGKRRISSKVNRRIFCSRTPGELRLRYAFPKKLAVHSGPGIGFNEAKITIVTCPQTQSDISLYPQAIRWLPRDNIMTPMDDYILYGELADEPSSAVSVQPGNVEPLRPELSRWRSQALAKTSFFAMICNLLTFWRVVR